MTALVSGAGAHQVPINLNTAKAIGLDISPTMFTRADEVIE